MILICINILKYKKKGIKKEKGPNNNLINFFIFHKFFMLKIIFILLFVKEFLLYTLFHFYFLFYLFYFNFFVKLIISDFRLKNKKKLFTF